LSHCHTFPSLLFPVFLQSGTHILAANRTNRTPWTLSRSRIRAGPLASNGQSPFVPNTAVAINADQTPYVLGNFPAKIALNATSRLQYRRSKLCQLLAGKIIGTLGCVYPSFCHNFLRPRKTDPANITQRVFDLFLSGYVNSKNSRHPPSSPLIFVSACA